MQFYPLPLEGAWLIEPELKEDERGFFARTWCRREFEEHGIACDWVQCNVSFNKRRGTLRGLHYQVAPWQEAKLVRCTRGAIFDVIADVRPASESFGKWAHAELTADNGKMLFVPKGFAHGFQTLVDETEVFYQMACEYHPEAACGIRWDDPTLAIVWPDCKKRTISFADQSLPEIASAGLPRGVSTKKIA